MDIKKNQKQLMDYFITEGRRNVFLSFIVFCVIAVPLISNAQERDTILYVYDDFTNPNLRKAWHKNGLNKDINFNGGTLNMKAGPSGIVIPYYFYSNFIDREFETRVKGGAIYGGVSIKITFREKMHSGKENQFRFRLHSSGEVKIDGGYPEKNYFIKNLENFDQQLSHTLKITTNSNNTAFFVDNKLMFSLPTDPSCSILTSAKMELDKYSSYVSSFEYIKMLAYKDNGAMFSEQELSTYCWNKGYEISTDYLGKNYEIYPFKDTTSKLNGYINRKGEILIPAKYNVALPFDNNVARVESEGKASYINTQGKIVLDYSKYKSINFYKGFAIVQDAINKKGVINSQGEIIIPNIYDDVQRNFEGEQQYFIVTLNKKWGLIDTKGNIIAEVKYDYLTGFYKNYAVVVLGKLYGVINKTGKEIIPPKYSLIINNDKVDEQSVSEGFFLVQKEGKYGFVNTNGIEIVAPKYEYARKFIKDLAPVKLNGKWGFINKKGEIVVPIKYDGIDFFNEVERNSDTLYGYFQHGYCAMNIGGQYMSGFTEGGKWGYIDNKGKELTEIIYMEAGNFEDGLARVKLSEGSTVQFIDTTGKIVLEVNKYFAVSSFSEGLALVYKENPNLSGCIDKSGKEIVPLSNMEFAHDYFFEGLVGVRIKKKSSNGLYEEYKYGFMDKTGKIVIQYYYDYVLPFENGKAKVKQREKEFYIDNRGNKIE